jgi:hypothetical protein
MCWLSPVLPAGGPEFQHGPPAGGMMGGGMMGPGMDAGLMGGGWGPEAMMGGGCSQGENPALHGLTHV